MSEKKTLWATIPGLVAGLAAIITGIVALVNLANSHSPSHPTPPQASAGAGVSGSLSPAGSPGTTGTPAAIGPASLSANPQSLDLGQATLGQATPPQTVTITNTGSTPATLGGVSLTPPSAAAFSIASSTCGNGTLAPQQTCQVSVRFTASAAGSSSASLTVSFGPPSGSSVTVALTGTGTLL